MAHATTIDDHHHMGDVSPAEAPYGGALCKEHHEDIKYLKDQVVKIKDDITSLRIKIAFISGAALVGGSIGGFLGTWLLNNLNK